MKSLKSTIAIILLGITTVLAGSGTKMVKSEYINGKITPVITLKTIEISADKKEVKLNGSMIDDKSFASSNSRLVTMIYINNKLVPLVNLKTVEVIASRNDATSNEVSVVNATVEIEKEHLVKTTWFNGEIMPSVELNTAEVITSQVEQNIAGKVSSQLIKLFTSTFIRF